MSGPPGSMTIGYDADGVRVKSVVNGVTTAHVGTHYETTGDSTWVDDSVPSGATQTGNSEGWSWNTTSGRVSGSATHESAYVAGMHQHYFYNATQTLSVAPGESLYAYVYLDPGSPPNSVMLQWNENGSWEHRAYWGADAFSWGTNGTDSRRNMGALPATGGWVRLEVPAALVGLEGKVLNGMAFTLNNGHAFWDKAGKTKTTKYYYFGGQRVALRQGNTPSWLHSDHLGSSSMTTSGTGSTLASARYKPFGEVRSTSGTLNTNRKFHGNVDDGFGTLHFLAREYSPLLGRFLSPDSIVPDERNPQAWNRYAYTYNSPLNYRDPSGHVPVRDIDDECNLLGCRDVVREGGGNIKYDAKTGVYQNFQTGYNSNQIAAPKTAKVPQLPAAGQSSASRPPVSSTNTNSVGTNSAGKPATGAPAIQQAMDKSVPAGKSSVGQNVYSTQPEAAAKDLAGRIASPNSLQSSTTNNGSERLTGKIEGGGTVNYRPPQGSDSGHHTVDVHNVPGYPRIVEFKFHLAPNVTAQ